MSAENTYKQLLPLAKYWLKELDFYGKNQFKRKLTETSWSVGQIYDHLLGYTQAVNIRNIEQCLNSKEDATKLGKTFKGFVHFAYKGYFPFKYKCDPYIEPQQPLSAEKVKDDFYRFLKLLHKVSKDIDYKKPKSKVLHPSFGYLSAEEWFQLIEMHFRHHRKQKNKMDLEVRSNFKETSSEDDDIPDIPNYES